MITVFHNPRCSKSRQGLAILEESGKDFQVIKYLDNTLTKKELSELISKLDIKPIDLVRRNEAIWKEKFKDQDLSDSAIIDAMVQHPKLIERPIVVNGSKATVGRPPETIRSIL